MIRQKCLTNILAHTWESFSYYHHIIFRKRIRHSLQSFHIIQISGGNPSCVWFGIMEYYERIWVSFWSANDFHPLLAQIFSSTFLFVVLFLFSASHIFLSLGCSTYSPPLGCCGFSLIWTFLRVECLRC